jgi:hypothetical protein
MNRSEYAKDTSIPALADLFTWDDKGVYLISARCRSCGTCFFPGYHEQHRPGCSREGIESILLRENGILASYTIQYFNPPYPFKMEKDITPYIIAEVEFPEGILVAGIMVECALNEVKIGMAVETTVLRMYQNDEKQDIVTWAFRPYKGNA